MKTSIVSTMFVASVATAISGCATASQFRGPITFSPDRNLVKSWAAAKTKDGALLVWGRVHSVKGYPGKLTGHLHIEAQDANGHTLGTVETSWGEFLARQFYSAYFRASLPVTDVLAVSQIKIDVKPDPL